MSSRLSLLEAKINEFESHAAVHHTIFLNEAMAAVDYAIKVKCVTGALLEKTRKEAGQAAQKKIDAIAKEKEEKIKDIRVEIRQICYEMNLENRAIDALFIVSQFDGFKWAHECRYVKDLCRATRMETGLWSAMSRVHYGPRKRTLLMYEAFRGRLSRVQWLLARTAPIEARDDRGWTALCYAVDGGSIKVVGELINAGAGVNITDNDGATPFLIAFLNGYIKVSRALISANADVDIADEFGRTPLYMASMSNRIDVVHELINAGAGVDIADKNGETPLFIASQWGCNEVVRALISANAGVNIARNDGLTPLSVTTRFPFRTAATIDTINALMEAGARW